MDSRDQLRSLVEGARKPGLMVVAFATNHSGDPLPWPELERWTRSRAVTVADINGRLELPALEVALCSDLVYLREGAVLGLPDAECRPSAGMVWALSRAGRPALAAGLLGGGPLAAIEARRVGLAQEVVAPHGELPLPASPGLAALTAARDLMRSRASGAAGLALELATFRLLFASGEPAEGARAFLDRRSPQFEDWS